MLLILVAGTIVEVLAEGSRIADRRRPRRRRPQGHTIVCGFGITGRHAISTLTARSTPDDRIVVVDPDADGSGEEV